VSILETIDHIYKDPVTIGGRQFYRVSKERLNQLSRRVDRMLAHQGETQQSPTALIQAHDQIAKLHETVKQMQGRIENLDSVVKDNSKSLETLRQEKAEAEVNLVRVRKLRETESSKLKLELNTAKANLETAKRQLSQPASTFDPDEAIRLTKERDEALSEVKRVNMCLEGFNKELQEKRDAVNSLQTKINSHEADLNAAKGQAAQLRNALFHAEETRGDLTFSPAIEALLGKEACLILAQWNQAAYDDAREKAFIAWTALKHQKSGLLAALSKLCKQVWLWCKGKSMKARKVIIPWLDVLFKHLASAKLKSIAFYRDELKAIVDIASPKIAKSVAGKRAEGHDIPDEPIFDKLWFYGYAVVLRIKRHTSNGLSSLITKVQNVKSSVTNWIFGEPRPAGAYPKRGKNFLARTPLFRALKRVWAGPPKPTWDRQGRKFPPRPDKINPVDTEIIFETEDGPIVLDI
jgi:predicted  nucleic acid-binding Zn-ribbon protein